MKKIILSIVLVLAVSGIHAGDRAVLAERNKTMFSCPPLKTPPIVDGAINPEEYRATAKISGGGRTTDARLLETWVGYDLDKLYLAVRSELPPGGKLATKARLSEHVLADDSVEILIVPPEGRREGSLQFGYFQLITNSEGVMWGRHHEPGWGLSSEVWQPDIVQKNRMTKDGFWEMEMSIPLKQMGWDKMPLPSQWKMIVARNFQYPRHQAAFTPAFAFNNPDTMAVLNCSGDLPSIQQSFPEWDTKRGADAVLDIFNPTNKNVNIIAELGYKKIKKENISIPPGRSRKVSISLDKEPNKYEFHARVSKDGETIFRRVAAFDTPPAKKWTNLEASLTFRAPISEQSGEFLLIENDKPLTYRGEYITIPGAIVVRFKPETQLEGKMKRIFFKSQYSKQGHFYLYENEKYLLLGFQFFPWQEGSSTRQIVVVKGEDTMKGWQTAIVNLEPDKATLFINGKLIGSLDFKESLEGRMLGDIVVGANHMENNFKISNIETYDRALSGDEIAMMGLGEAGLGGKIWYFASLNELVVEAEVNPFALPENPKISLVVTEGAPSNRIIKKVDYAVEDFKPLNTGYVILRHRVELPELKDGDYYTYMSLKSKEGSAAFLGRIFTVKKYDWVNNKIGLSNTIVPPFTPLQVNGQEVGALMKKYTIGNNGLPERIVADGESILSRPIRGVLTASGKTYPWKHSEVKFTKKEDTTVKYVANSENDLFEMTINGEFDYDGLLKLTLKLSPRKPGQKIDSFYLDIPVKKSIAKLFHAAGHGNRSNPAGHIPEGKGLVWGCRSIPHALPNFIPYIWVGGAEKGICYAADWDKDWIHSANRNEHAVELYREDDGVVSIRLNLINHAPLGRERELEITLLATPVKPMPEEWRAWSDNYANFKFPGRKFLQALYTGLYWGMPFDWSGRYPAFEDFEIIRKLDETRRTGIIDRDFIEKYVDRLMAASVKEVPAKVRGKERLRIMVQAGFNAMRALADQKDTLVYHYTCLFERGNALLEFPVFEDEWHFRVGKYHPIKSWRDWAVYYDSKMIDAGFDGVYLDNTAFVIKRCWPTGDGYIDDDNNIQPSFGLWRMRNYIKRLATMFAEKDKMPFIWVHTTNSLPIPCFSFATATMDLEWKYGDKDYQDRHRADYLLAVAAGRQGGFFPTVIDGIRSKPEQKVWLTRTMLACLLPLEIQPTIGIGGGSDLETMRNAYRILWDFGKAEPDTQFIGYWEDNTPIIPESGNLIVSAYVRDNKILLVVGNYGNDGEIPIKINLAQIGLKSLDSAVNKETMESLDIVNPNTLMLKIKKYDFALIELKCN